MSEDVSANSPKRVLFNTGNPVFDAVVMAYVMRPGMKRADLPELHKVLVELAAKEPGGFQRIRNETGM